jgi:hypothetical protein
VEALFGLRFVATIPSQHWKTKLGLSGKLLQKISIMNARSEMSSGQLRLSGGPFH